MGNRDRYHNEMRAAIEKDGWVVTDDPYKVSFDGRMTLDIDIGAYRVIAADRGTERIAVEFKSMSQAAPMKTGELYLAIGQFILYREWMGKQEPERRLFLGVTRRFADIELPLAGIRYVLETNKINLVVIDVVTKEVVRWILW